MTLCKQKTLIQKKAQHHLYLCKNEEYSWIKEVNFHWLNLIIFRAAIAESSPLLYLPPLLSTDWLILSSVETHKIIGISDIIFKSLIPFTTALDTNSKCLVSPWIIHPIAITASRFLFIRFLHAKINSKLFLIYQDLIIPNLY